MPFHIDAILKENNIEETSFYKQLMEYPFLDKDNDGCTTTYDLKDSKTLEAYYILDAITQEPIGRFILTIKNKGLEDESVADIDFVLNNQETNCLHLVQYLYSDLESDNFLSFLNGKFFEVTLVNRSLLENDLKDKSVLCTCSYFPYELVSAKTIDSLKEKLNDNSIVDNTILLAKNLDDESLDSYSRIVGRVIGKRNVKLKFNKIELECNFAMIHTLLGDCPMVTPCSFEFESGDYVAINSPILCDLSVGSNTYYPAYLEENVPEEYFDEEFVDEKSEDDLFDYGLFGLGERRRKNLLGIALRQGYVFESLGDYDYVNAWFEGLCDNCRTNKIVKGKDLQVVLKVRQKEKQYQILDYDLHETGNCQLVLKVKKHLRDDIYEVRPLDFYDLSFEMKIINQGLMDSCFENETIRLQTIGTVLNGSIFSSIKEMKKYCEECLIPFIEDKEVIGCNENGVLIRGPIKEISINKVCIQSTGFLCSHVFMKVQTKLGILDIIDAIDAYPFMEIEEYGKQKYFCGYVQLQGDGFNDENKGELRLKEESSVRILRDILVNQKWNHLDRIVHPDVEVDWNYKKHVEIQRGLFNFIDTLKQLNSEMSRPSIGYLEEEKDGFQQERMCISLGIDKILFVEYENNLYTKLIIRKANGFQVIEEDTLFQA